MPLADSPLHQNWGKVSGSRIKVTGSCLYAELLQICPFLQIETVEPRQALELGNKLVEISVVQHCAVELQSVVEACLWKSLIGSATGS